VIFLVYIGLFFCFICILFLLFFLHSRTALERRWRCLRFGFLPCSPATRCVRHNIITSVTRSRCAKCEKYEREIYSHRRASLPRDPRSRSISFQRKDQQITYLGWVRVGIRSGEVTPNSPSRPHSSMSQQSASSVGSSNVNLRTRTAASRRPRPASIAGTGVSVTEKHSEHAYFTSPTEPFRSSRISDETRKKKERKNDLSKLIPRLTKILGLEKIVHRVIESKRG